MTSEQPTARTPDETYESRKHAASKMRSEVMAPVKAERLRKIAEAATRGEWRAPGDLAVWLSGGGVIAHCFWVSGAISAEQAEANAEHIATFDPPTVLSLLSTLEAQREALERIASGTEDQLPPFRAAPAERLRDIARTALSNPEGG